MIGLLLFGGHSAGLQAQEIYSTAPRFDIDLYLVANNVHPITSIEFDKEQAVNDPIRAKLANILNEHDMQKRSMIVVDGHDTIGWKEQSQQFKYSLFERSHDIQTIDFGNGQPRQTQDNVMSSMTVATYPAYRNDHSGGASFVLLGRSLTSTPSTQLGVIEPTFGIQSLGARRNAKLWQDRKYTNIMLNFSSESVIGTEQIIDNDFPNYGQVCICTWGIRSPTNPNLISFPPANVIKYYKFGFDGAKWYAHLEGIIR